MILSFLHFSLALQRMLLWVTRRHQSQLARGYLSVVARSSCLQRTRVAECDGQQCSLVVLLLRRTRMMLLCSPRAHLILICQTHRSTTSTIPKTTATTNMRSFLHCLSTTTTTINTITAAAYVALSSRGAASPTSGSSPSQ